MSRFNKIVRLIDSTIDQIRQPGMNRTSVLRPGRLKMNTVLRYAHARPA